MRHCQIQVSIRVIGVGGRSWSAVHVHAVTQGAHLRAMASVVANALANLQPDPGSHSMTSLQLLWHCVWVILMMMAAFVQLWSPYYCRPPGLTCWAGPLHGACLISLTARSHQSW